MPNLVVQGLKIRDVRARRVPFRKVRVGQIFYSDRRWYQRRSARMALRADCPETETIHFSAGTVVRVFDETVSSHRATAGLSFDEFILQTGHE